MNPSTAIKSNTDFPDRGIPIFLLTDEQGLIYGASESLQLFTGKSRHELIGHSIATFLSESETNKFRSFIGNAGSDELDSCSILLKGRRQDDKMSFFVKRRKTGSNLFDWTCIAGNNFREMLKGYDEMPWFIQFFERSAEPVFIYNAVDLSLTFVNEAALHLYGYAGKDLLNGFLYDDEAIHQSTSPEQPHILQPGNYSLFSKTGQQVSVQVFTSPIDIHGITHCLVFGTQVQVVEKENVSLIPYKETPTTLQHTPGELDMIVASMDDVVFEYDNEGRFRKVWCRNETVLLMIPEQFLGKSMQEAFRALPDFVAPFIQDFETALSRREICYRDFPIRSANSTRWFNSKITPLFHASGAPKGFTQRITDITEQKMVQLAIEEKNSELKSTHKELQQLVESLKETEERYSAFINHSTEAIWRFEYGTPLPVTHPVDAIIDVFMEHAYLAECNDQMARFYGYEKASEIIGAPLRNLLPPDDPRNIEYLRAFIQNGFQLNDAESFEIDKHGNKKYFLNNLIGIVRDGLLLRVWGTQRDITDQRKAEDHRKGSEEALRISEQRYRSLVEALGEGIFLIDKNGDIIASNKSAQNITGRTKEELLKVNMFTYDWKMIHEDGTPYEREEKPSYITLTKGTPLQNVIMGVMRTNQHRCWLSVNTEPIYYSSGSTTPDAIVISLVDITEKKIAELELQRSEQQLREYSERITNLLDSITDGFLAVDNDLKVVLWNRVLQNITGRKSSEVIGKSITELYPEILEKKVYQKYFNSLKHNTPVTFEAFSEGLNIWFESSAYPSGRGLFIYFRDITERKTQEHLLSLEKDVLEINAQPSASLKNTVDYFLEGIERIFPGMLCSVLTVDADAKKIRHLSAPSLPSTFAAAVDGLNIGPKAGSCGTAMYLRQRVISVDIEQDPIWENTREIFLQFDIRSSWAFPIMNIHGEVVATISAYHRHPKAPGDKSLRVLERISNLLRIIIVNKNAEEMIRLSNERFQLISRAANDAIWDWDLTTNKIYWGEGFYLLFSYEAGYRENSVRFWEEQIHDDDREIVLKSLNNFLNSKKGRVWSHEYRFRKADGNFVLVLDRGFLIYNQDGSISRMVGSMQDITEKREMEKQLLKQQLTRQQMIAQAVVDAQEKERADIGKELHDNVNQILSTARLFLDLARSDENERINLIKRSTENISDAINEIRNISRSLVPGSIGDLGIIESINDLVETVRATRKLHVEFYHEGDADKILDEKQKLMLFRIIQEQVNNVLKHAEARNLVIELVVYAEGIDLTISDNGIGFELDKIKNKKGVGLYNITSRAELFNGKVNIVTSPGNGCKMNIHVPIINL